MQSSMTTIWIWHVVSAVIAVLVSLSLFYQGLERRLSVYQPLREADVEEVRHPDGHVLTGEELKDSVIWYNGLTYMGRRTPTTLDYTYGHIFRLRSGEELAVIWNEPFFEVKRVRKKGKTFYFRLYRKPE